MAVFCFVSELTPYGETAAKEVGVHPILVWWRRGELNPCPKVFPHGFLRVYAVVKVPAVLGQVPNLKPWYPQKS